MKGLIFKKNDKHFLDAIIAACAMVVYADEKIEDRERLKFQDVLINNDIIRSFELFNIDEVIITFNSYLELLEKTHFHGTVQLVDKIKKIKNPQQANLLSTICYITANADHNMSEYEYIVIKEICQILNIEQPDFNDLVIIDDNTINKVNITISKKIIDNEKDATSKLVLKAIPAVAIIIVKYCGKTVVSIIEEDNLMKPSIIFAYNLIPIAFGGSVIRTIYDSETFCTTILKYRNLLANAIRELIDESALDKG